MQLKEKFLLFRARVVHCIGAQIELLFVVMSREDQFDFLTVLTTI